jgi:chemotaxis protein MotB
MATFADLMSLLLTFFVLLLSFANMDVVKFREILGSLREAFGYQTEAFGSWNPVVMSTNKDNVTEQAVAEPQDAEDNAHKAQQKQQDMSFIDELQKVIKELKLDNKVDALSTARGIVIRAQDGLFFERGSTRIDPESYLFLEQMSVMFQRFPYDVLVEGHTDNRPVRARKSESNWELSTSRAIAVMRYLTEVGGIDPRRIGASGYAHMRPIAVNTTSKGRSKNRRVEFVCHRNSELTRAKPIAVPAPPAHPSGDSK